MSMTDEPNRRRARLNQQFRREITEILLKSVRDPRVQDVVVNSVEVTADLWLARVYVRVGGDDAERAEALLGLDAAANFVRRELAGVLHIRRIPELRFLEDKTLAQAHRIEEILKGLDKGQDSADDGSEGSGDG
jgi:ribosome-binding factor A